MSSKAYEATLTASAHVVMQHPEIRMPSRLVPHGGNADTLKESVLEA
ncbi:MAG: hypothetical protein ACFBSG_12350 [Leptolyngbyaceae cyanobacterium]